MPGSKKVISTHPHTYLNLVYFLECIGQRDYLGNLFFLLDLSWVVRQLSITVGSSKGAVSLEHHCSVYFIYF